MDRDRFWQEVIDLVKHHKQSSNSVNQLPEEQMQQIEFNVYAHIDQLFSDSEVTLATAQADVTTVDAEHGGQHQRPLKQGNSLWTRLFRYRRTPVFVVAVFAVFTAGVLVYLLSDNQPEPLFDIPESVIAADVDSYIQIPQQGARAMAGTIPSERRSAFLAGVTQADLDLIGKTDTPKAHQIALWYHHTTTNSSVDDVPGALTTVQSSVARYSANEQTRLWLKHGYAVEVVHLAAQRSLVDMNQTAIIDALDFYRAHVLMPESGGAEPKTSRLETNSADVAKQYIENHEKLLAADPRVFSTPEPLQDIVDTTNQMKVLIQ